MSRADYSDDLYGWELTQWRAAVASALRGRRGQAMLRELRAALEALPTKELVAESLELEGGVCALGAVGQARGMDLSNLAPENYEQIAQAFGVAEAMAREIMYINDEDGCWDETPEDRYHRVLAWVNREILE